MRHSYTHYAPQTAFRLDRIYVTHHLLSRKQGVETVASAFMDHLAVVLRLAIDILIPATGRGYWRMNVSYLHEKTFHDNLTMQWTQWQQTMRWTQWQQHKRFYPNSIPWWGHYVKRLVRQLLTSEGTNRCWDHQTLENFYYDALYTVLHADTITDRSYVTLKKLKAKIVRLHQEPQKLLFLHTNEQDKCEDEMPSLYHVLRLRKRQESRTIDRVYNSEGNLQTSPPTILRTFTEFMKKKYSIITVDDDSLNRILQHTRKTVPPLATEALDMPITMEELRIAVKQGKKLKAPGYDGICHDFFPTCMGDNQTRLTGCDEPDVQRRINIRFTETWHYCMLAKKTQACPSRRVQTAYLNECRLQTAVTNN